MVKKFILATALLAGTAPLLRAQTTVRPCGTDEVSREWRQQHAAEVAASEALWQQYIDAALHKMDISKFAKVTVDGNNMTKVYHIPVVFHIIHEYGGENVKDNDIYNALAEINEMYDKRNADTSDVISPFKRTVNGTNSRYIGHTKFVFHLASKDPLGRPTNGVTRRRSYLTLKGGDFGKLDGWAPDSYVNIWINRNITVVGAAAYAFKPADVDNPSGRIIDGVMVGWNATTSNGNVGINNENTIAHELGHSFSLDHPWGGTNNPGVACGDDGVDDTPPTQGHGAGAPTSPRNITGCTPFNLYDTACVYTPAAIGKLVIDTVGLSADVVTGQGPTFDVYTPTWLDSVAFYSRDTGRKLYTINLVQNNTVINSYTDSTTLVPGRQRVPLGFNLAVGTGYSLVFGVNPGAYRDSVKTSFTTAVPGSLQFTSDTALNKPYRYFYKWALRYGYFRFYDSSTYRALYFDTTNTPYNSVFQTPGARYFPNSGFLVDYPDTSNSQNVMDYTYCSKMFTHGQATRMRLAASSPIAGRNSLSTESNLKLTGVMDASGALYSKRPDAPPVADFSVNRFTGGTLTTLPERMYVQPGVYNTSDIAYRCTDETFTFTNQSWGDTITNVNWYFSNGATPATSTSTGSVGVKFSEPGWATVTLVATGNNTGSDSEVRQPVYVADKSKTISPIGYFQDFRAEDSDRDRWPIFNYYNNSFKWQVLENVGLYDKACISYRNFDARVPPAGSIVSALSLPGSTPEGDYDDFFSPPFNLTDLKSGNCNLNFHYAGASRSTISASIRDTLMVSASTDCGANWTVVDYLSKRDLNTNGTVGTAYTPNAMSEWRLRSIDLRKLVGAASDVSNVLFRFRFRPGADPEGARLGTGNNFYMDRIYVSNNPLGVDNDVLAARGLALVPNPTSGASTVVVKNATGMVNVQVTDITGKVVYQTAQAANGAFTQVEVPAASLQVKGIYLVQVTSNGTKQTEKLVVY